MVLARAWEALAPNRTLRHHASPLHSTWAKRRQPLDNKKLHWMPVFCREGAVATPSCKAFCHVWPRPMTTSNKLHTRAPQVKVAFRKVSGASSAWIFALPFFCFLPLYSSS